MVDVTVVIPTYNGGDRLEQCFDQLDAQRTSLSYEVCIIDSGSRDGTVASAQRRGYRLVDPPTGAFNHGATRDHAIAQTGGDSIALLVQDAIPVDERWLDALVQPLLADDEAAGSFSRQLPIPGGNPILDERLRGWIAGRDEARRMQLESAEQWDTLTPMERLEMVAFDNVASCIKRSLWEKRPFGHRPFGEDLGWSTWAIREGYAIRFEPLSVVEHSHDRSPWYEARRIYCDHRNLNKLLGFRSFPRLRNALDSRPHALAHYLGILERAELDERERAQRIRWARRYAWGECLAQWLAPRVNDAGERGLLGWLDRRIRKGI